MMLMIRCISMLIVLLVQPVILMAEVTEVDVLDASAGHKSRPLLQSPTTVEETSLDKPALAADVVSQKSIKNAYRLGVGDKIDIRVFGQDELSFSTTLDESGGINYQFVGEIPALGMTTSELEQFITSGLKAGYLVSPHVNVAIVEYRPFYIKGKVVSPGSYPYQPGLTVAKAITVSGGFSEYAAKDEAFVLREGGKLVSLGMSGLIRPGDTITIHESVFYIDGEVKRPGKYPFHEGLTVREAISLAGGVSERASMNKIYVKTSAGKFLHVGQDNKVQPSASIVVQQSFF